MTENAPDNVSTEDAESLPPKPETEEVEVELPPPKKTGPVRGPEAQMQVEATRSFLIKMPHFYTSVSFI